MTDASRFLAHVLGGNTMKMLKALVVSAGLVTSGGAFAQSADYVLNTASKLRANTDENAKQKRLLADTMLVNVVLKDFLEKN
jgi:hypothetical protein